MKDRVGLLIETLRKDKRGYLRNTNTKKPMPREQRAFWEGSANGIDRALDYLEGRLKLKEPVEPDLE